MARRPVFKLVYGTLEAALSRTRCARELNRPGSAEAVWFESGLHRGDLTGELPVVVFGIPLQAYDYVVNGKPALDWVVERQGVKTDKDSGIVNDANDWAVETMGSPRYPLELLQRVVTVSLETMKIVRALPKLDIASAAS